MIRRNRFQLLLALLVSAAMLWGCGDKEDGAVPAEAHPADGQPTDVADPSEQVLQPPKGVQRPDAPQGTSSVEDARIANDVLLKLVADREIDALNFSLRVNNGVVTLIPGLDATEQEKERAVLRAKEIRSVQDVRIEDASAKQADAAPSNDEKEVLDAVDEIQEAEADDFEAFGDTDDADEIEQIEHAAEIAEPAEEPAAQNDADADEVQAAQDEQKEPSQADSAPSDARTYTVKRGDSLSGIAAREMGAGARWMDLYEYNKSVIGANPDGLREGMVLTLPND